MAKKYDVNMPITNALYNVLFNEVDAKDAVDALMARGKTHEMEDLTNVFDEIVYKKTKYIYYLIIGIR